jgi:CRP-like cAMP-binding protein
MLHEYLWKNRSRNDKIDLPQGQIAEMFGVSIYTMSRIFNEMLENGQLLKIKGTFYVLDPVKWKWSKALENKTD